MTIPTNSWVHDKAKLELLAHRIDKSVRLYTKDNWFARLLAVLVPIVTFGGMKKKTFLEHFATTIGPLQFYPVTWPTRSVQRVLVHESRHTRQARWFGLWIHPWVGLPIYVVLYLLLPLPLGLAFFRALFERDAMKYELSVLYRSGSYSDVEVINRANKFGNTVSSGRYGWSLPRRWCVAWFEEAGEEVLREVTPRESR